MSKSAERIALVERSRLNVPKIYWSVYYFLSVYNCENCWTAYAYWSYEASFDSIILLNIDWPVILETNFLNVCIAMGITLFLELF